MTTSAIFSHDYYSKPWLFFDQVKRVKSDGTIVIEMSAISDFWKHRLIHTDLDKNGTIIASPFGRCADIIRHLMCFQDRQLLNVNRRLKQLETQLRNPSSPEALSFRQEVHSKGSNGAHIFQTNLRHLCKCFEKGNHKSPQSLAALKAINSFRKLFHMQPIAFHRYESIDQEVFARMIPQAMQITPQETTQSTFQVTIQNTTSFPLPELRQENLLQLEYGLRDNIYFEIEQRKFCLAYNKQKGVFVLSYYADGNIHTPPTLTQLMQQKKDYAFRSPLIKVSRKKFGDENATLHDLQFFENYKRGRWFQSFIEKYESSNKKLSLSAGYEYTIPFSQGNLNLKLVRRTS